MAIIMNGKELSKKIRTDLKREVDDLKNKNIFPKLAVIMVGNDNSSKIYVKNKSLACKEVGIEYEEFLLDETTSQEKLIDLIEQLNNREDVQGILLQSPVPKHLDIEMAFRTISPKKDVDGFNPINVGLLQIGDDCFCPCTPFGVIRMLKEYNIEISGKNAVVVGRSNIVGKPMANMLLNENATITVCHSKTKNLEDITKEADILISAIGKPKFIKDYMVKKNAVIVDVGMNRDDKGNLCGDVDFDSIVNKASYITPVPGGVGPMTITMLMNNVVKACKNLK